MYKKTIDFTKQLGIPIVTKCLSVTDMEVVHHRRSLEGGTARQHPPFISPPHFTWCCILLGISHSFYSRWLMCQQQKDGINCNAVILGPQSTALR